MRASLAVAALVRAISAGQLEPWTGDAQHVLGDGGKERDNNSTVQGPVMKHNFPDPHVMQYNNTWWAFGTNNPPSPHPHVQVASSSDFASWTLSKTDPLPDTGTWSVGNSTWSPSVIQRVSLCLACMLLGRRSQLTLRVQPDGKWILYYTNPITADPGKHCIGAAISSSITGPYTPISQSRPLICDLGRGGAIDPAAFRDTDGSHWIVYKVDGNSIGHGGSCSNGVPPIAPTPIMLQRLDDQDLVTLQGEPIVLITNDEPEDGPNVESPSLVKSPHGVYFLFFSSNCFTSPRYDIAYATADHVAGPYTRRNVLLATGDLGLQAPGAVTVDLDSGHCVFHANCEWGRCLWTGVLQFNGTTAQFV